MIIEWLPGYCEDVFNNGQNLVIASNEIIDEMDLYTNDTIAIDLFFLIRGDGFGTMVFEPFRLIDLQVAGFYEFDDELDGLRPMLVISHHFIHQEFQREGMVFDSASLSFGISNPLDLNLFKEEMNELGFHPLNVEANVFGNVGDTLVVDDSAFVYGASQLVQSLQLLQSFYPVIFLAAGLIVFFVSYLTIQSRRQEYLVFRLLGISRNSCLLMYFIEQNILFILGKLVAILLVAIFLSQIELRGLYPLLIAYLLFCIGSLTSLLFFERQSIMISVSKRE
jgi:ABC-type antimicrobial peptide transport system permease subunit